MHVPSFSERIFIFLGGIFVYILILLTHCCSFQGVLYSLLVGGTHLRGARRPGLFVIERDKISIDSDMQSTSFQCIANGGKNASQPYYFLLCLTELCFERPNLVFQCLDHPVLDLISRFGVTMSDGNDASDNRADNYEEAKRKLEVGEKLYYIHNFFSSPPFSFQSSVRR